MTKRFNLRPGQRRLVRLGVLVGALAAISWARRRVRKPVQDRYLSALQYSWLTPFYDFAQRWIFRESIFKAHLVEQARIEPGHRVLDLGCGTATLTLLIKQNHPEAEVTGLDGDPEALGIAESKASKAGLSITFDRGMAFQLPYPDGFFDRVISSLVFHHLTKENKYRAMREVLRVLRPGGEFHLTDLGRPHNPIMYIVSLVFSRLEEAEDNVRGLLPQMLADADFEQVEEIARFSTPYGAVSSLRARKALTTTG